MPSLICKNILVKGLENLVDEDEYYWDDDMLYSLCSALVVDEYVQILSVAGMYGFWEVVRFDSGYASVYETDLWFLLIFDFC